jgi:hypothetical protein
MRGGVDSAREATDDHHSARGKIGRELFSDGEAIGRRGARSDDGYGRRAHHVGAAAAPEHRRRIHDRRQRRGIGGIIPGNRGDRGRIRAADRIRRQ